MIKYKEPWSAGKDRIASECGDPIVKTYTPYYDDNGVLQLKESGSKNLYDEIQSHKLSCDIHYILQRFANGEVDVLSKAQGLFGDFVDVPHSFAEMMNLTIDAELKFKQLPVEVKEKFNNDFVQYMQSYGSDEWAMKLGFMPAANVDSVSSTDKEVKSDES